MTSDSSNKASRRKPTKREPARPTTPIDPHYSKLTRKSTLGSTQHRVSSVEEAQAQNRMEVTQRMEAQPSDNEGEAQEQYIGFEPLLHETHRRVYGNESGKRASVTADSKFALIAALVALIVFFAGGYYLWSHRPVKITVNDSSLEIRIGSTLDEVYAASGAANTPGNLVSVGGNLLEEGTGYRYSSNLGDQPLSLEEMSAFRVHGGEVLWFGDGWDRTEDYDVASYNDIPPRLAFEGEGGAVGYVKQWGVAGRQETRVGKVSGETIEGVTAQDSRDCIVALRDIVPANEERLVAIAFDGGPDANYTESCLQILEQHDAKATFFFSVDNVNANLEQAKKVVASSSQVCCKTNPAVELTALGQDDLVAELNHTHDTLADLIGVDSTILRPTNGAFSHETWLMSQGIMAATVAWNTNGLDWTTPGAEAIVENALAGVRPGSVISLLDGGGDRSQTVEALPAIIERLQADGYRLVTISELLASDPEVPADVASGNAHMPADATWPVEIVESVG